MVERKSSEEEFSTNTRFLRVGSISRETVSRAFFGLFTETEIRRRQERPCWTVARASLGPRCESASGCLDGCAVFILARAGLERVSGGAPIRIRSKRLVSERHRASSIPSGHIVTISRDSLFEFFFLSHGPLVRIPKTAPRRPFAALREVGRAADRLRFACSLSRSCPVRFGLWTVQTSRKGVIAEDSRESESRNPESASRKNSTEFPTETPHSAAESHAHESCSSLRSSDSLKQSDELRRSSDS